MNTHMLFRLADALDGLEPVGEDFVLDPESFLPPAEWKMDIVDHRFQMGNWLNRNAGGCGTAGCIAGTVCVLWPPREEVDWYGEFSYAAELLGLSLAVARKLFYAPPLSDDLDSVTPTEAAAAVRMLAKFGEVDWIAVRESCTVPRT